MSQPVDFGRIIKFYHLPLTDIDSKRFDEVRTICHSLNGMYCTSMKRHNRYIPCGFVFSTEDEIKQALERLTEAGIL